MLVSVLGKEVELQPKPIGIFPEYNVYETTDGHIVHLDLDGQPIIYTSYMGYEFGIMHTMNAFIKDLGDRIEIQKYVGGMHHWYRYHIDKKTRRAITYFESKVELSEDEVDTSVFRVWSSANLGDHLVIAGASKSLRLISRVDGSDASITDPNGSVVSDILDFNRFDEDWVAVRSKKGQFHITSMLDPVVYSNLETGEKLSYFDQTTVDGSDVWVHKGWRKYLVNPLSRSIINEKLDWVPRFRKLLITLGIVSCVIFAAYVISQAPDV